MILPDSSAWIEFLRGTGSPTAQRLRVALESEPVLTIGPVTMEVLAGARDQAESDRLTSLLYGACTVEPTEETDFRRAADLHRACRRGGDSVRKLLDCLIAAVAIRLDADVLHRDRDFEVLARHSALRALSA